jgi:spermidine synthase
MGMVSPFAIKLQVKGLDTVGNTAGSLYAVSTLGSIAGTLGTSFFLITWLGTKLIIHLLGIVLLILAFAVAVMDVHQKRQSHQVVQTKVSRGHVDKKTPGQNGSGRGKKTLILLALAALSGGMHTEAVSPSVSPDKIVYEKDSLYHRITVADEDGLRYLKFDASWQSAMYIDKPDKLVFPYTEFFHLEPLLNLQAKNALLVGLGGGSVPKNFLVNYPKLQFDVVEIDPEVITVAKRFFALKDDARLSLVARDGRTFFKQNKNWYDMIFLDAYYADAIPFHLATQEYMRELSGHLSSDGVVVSNVIGAVSGTRSRMFRSILKTYQSVFPHVYAFAVGKFQGNVSADKLQNIIVVSLCLRSRMIGKRLRLERRAKSAR